MKRIFVILLIAWSASLCHAQNIEQAWDMVWSRFYLPNVQAFGDFLSSSEKNTGNTFAERYRNGRFSIPSPILAKAKPHPDGRQDGAIASLTSRVLVLQIKSIEVHDLGPGGDEVGDELRLVVVAGIDFGDGAELGV